MSNGLRMSQPIDAATARVCIVLPLRNEESSIGETLESILRQTFPPERLEIVAVDGASTDSSPDIIQKAASRDPRIRLLRSSNGSTPSGLNLGISTTTADVVIRVDARSCLAPDYVDTCIRLLAQTRAGNVGGLMRPRAMGAFGEAVALATTSRFGIGNARFHYLERQTFVDTVYLGAFPRSVLVELGGYDERLVRNQDDELNYRIRKAGYGVLLSPDIVSSYVPRSNLRSLWRQYHQYGFWKVKVIEKHPGSIQTRHIAPALMISILSLSTAGFLATRRQRMLAPWVVYSISTAVAALMRARFRAYVVPQLAAVFLTLHFAYGTGFLRGLLALASRRSE